MVTGIVTKVSFIITMETHIITMVTHILTGGNIFLKLILDCCVTGPELLHASLIYTSTQQFRT